MAFEVSVAIVLKENSGDGSIVAVMESETLFPPRAPIRASGQEQMAAVLGQLFAQGELRVSAMCDAVRDKAMEQLREHRARVESGEHPLMME